MLSCTTERRASFHRRAARGSTVGALLVALVGCAAGRSWHAPAAPAGAGYFLNALPERTPAAPVHGGESQRLVAGADVPFAWWALFQSSALNDLVDEALKANPTIDSARAALAQAQELVRAQRGFFFPTVAAVGQAERHKVSGNTNNSETIGVQGSGLNKLPLVPETPASVNSFPRNLPSYYTFYTAGLTVEFVPDVFGANRRQVESLAATSEVQRFQLEATYVTLVSNVVAAAIQDASLRAQIQGTQQIIAADEQALKILRDQFALGFVMRIDVAAQEALLAQAKTLLPPLQRQAEQTRDLMRVLVGGLPSDLTKRFELDTLQLPTDLPITLPSKLIEQRPDVRAAQAQMRAANAQVGVALAAMLPTFPITGQYGGNATQISQIFSAGGPFWTIIGDAIQPVFQGATLLHQKRAAGEALKESAAVYRETVITAYQNVADALHVSLADAESLAADVRAEHAAKVAYDLTLRQLEVGFVTPLTLLNAEASYQQTLLTRVQAQATRYGDSVALFQALGGGWWNRPEVAAR